jgi:RecJ-like exonuclease
MTINWDELGPKLLDVIGSAEMEDCPSCEGTGKENRTDACRECGGCGRDFMGIWPPHVEDALKAAREAGALK